MPEHAYARLAAEIAEGIADGTYRPGDRLPSVRALRRSTQLSAATICRAFEEVERRGLIEARPRSGWYVLSRKPGLATPSHPRRSFVPKTIALHELTDSIVATTGSKGLIPFGGTSVAPSLLPTKLLARTTRAVLRTQPDVLVRYSDPVGVLPLRRAIAKRSGWRTSNVVVTNGCMEALQLSLLASTKPGDLVAIETPTFFGFLQLVRDLERRAIEIPVDPHKGLDLDSLEAAAARHPVRAVLVTPSFQNPLGVTMSPIDRARLVRIARTNGFVAIESDVYGELEHNGEPQAPVAAFDDTGTVMTCSQSRRRSPRASASAGCTHKVSSANGFARSSCRVRSARRRSISSSSLTSSGRARTTVILRGFDPHLRIRSHQHPARLNDTFHRARR